MAIGRRGGYARKRADWKVFQVSIKRQSLDFEARNTGLTKTILVFVSNMIYIYAHTAIIYAQYHMKRDSIALHAIPRACGVRIAGIASQRSIKFHIYN